jgi:predicted chitinase
MLRVLLQWFGNSNKMPAVKNQSLLRRVPQFESLEDRTLLSVTGVTTIDFDTLPDRSPVTGQYESQGVTFGGGSVLSESTQSLNSPQFPPHSGNNVIYDDPSLGGGLITAAPTGGDFTDVGAYVTGNVAITMTAYDSGGSVVGTQSTGGPNYAPDGVPNLLLEIQAPHISYVTFNDHGNTFTVDDFFFSAQPVIPKAVQPNYDGSLTVTFEVLDQLDPGDQIPIGVYWATGPNGPDALKSPAGAISSNDPHAHATSVDDALATYQVDSSFGPGTYTFTVSADKVSTAAHEVQDLLVVADPDENLQPDGDPAAVLAVATQTGGLTDTQLAAMMPNLTDTATLAPALSDAMQTFGITSLEQQAMFLAQLDAESQGLTRWEERWTSAPNYKLPGSSRAAHTATDEVDYFNYWYGNRPVLGNTQPDDGYNFHGRGPIQLTGRANYQAFANYIGDQSIMTDPDQLSDRDDPLLGIESAAWFFSQRAHLNTLTDNDAGKTSVDFNSDATRAVNGGLNGLATRLADYRRIRAVFLLQDGDPLVVTTQPPGTVAAGQAFGLVVSAQNNDGTTNTDFNGDVTVSLMSATGTAKASLAGTVTAQAVDGVATFTNVAIDGAANANYYLAVGAAGLPSASSQLIDVVPGAATQLLLKAPSAGLANRAFNLTVDAADPFGNLDSNFNGDVTLSLANNPNAATLGGTLTMQALAGEAHFTALTIDKPGAGYSLRAAATGLTPGATAGFDIVRDGWAVTAAPPTVITAGSGFGLTVAAQDSLGRVDTSYNGPVTIALVNNNLYTGAILSGTLTATAVNGVATFSGLSIQQIGSFSLAINASGLLGVTTTAFNVTAAAATQLIVSTPFGSLSHRGQIVAGGTFSMQILAEDRFGNLDSTFTGNVTLTLSGNTTGAVLGGSVTLPASGGVARFSNLTIDTAGTGYVLQAASNLLTTAISAPFSVVAGQLSTTTQPPSSIGVGAPFSVSFSALTPQNTVDTSFNGPVTITLDSYSGVAATLSGPLTATAVNGVATFSGLSVDHPGSFAISANSTVYAGVISAAFSVKAVPSSLKIAVQPPATVTTGAPFAVDVNVIDSSGNLATDYFGPVTIALANNPGGAALTGTLTVNASSGVATFANLSLDKLGEGYTLRATTGALPPTVTGAFAVAATGVATHLVVTAEPPLSVTAGNPFGLVVSAEDDFGHVDTSFNASMLVRLTSGPARAVLDGPISVAVVNGVASFTGLTLNVAGSYQLEARSQSLSVTATLIAVTHAVATNWAIEEPILNQVADMPFTVSVLATDALGNLAPTFSGTVSLSLAANPGSATLGGTLTVQAVAGVATFSGITMSKSGTGYVLQAAGDSLTAAQSGPFNVTTDRLAVTAQVPSIETAGAPFGLTVVAENSAGETDTSFVGPVTVSLTQPANSTVALGGSATVTAVNGIATFTGLSLAQAGQYELTITSRGAATAVSAPFEVRAATASRLVITGQPSTARTAGSQFELDVVAQDAFGNVDPQFAGPITIALTNNAAGAILSGTLTSVAVQGEVSFAGLSIDKPGASYVLQVSAPALPVVLTAPLNIVSPGVATRLVVTTQPSTAVRAETNFGLVVVAQDDLGNVATGFTGGITVTDPFGATLATNSAFAGTATFSGLNLKTAGSYQLSLTSSGLSSAETDAFAVEPGSANHLVFIGPATNVLTGAPFDASALALDTDGNIDTNFNGTVALSLGAHPVGAMLSGYLTATASNGRATFSADSINQAGTGYTLKASSSGLTDGISRAFDVSSEQLVIAKQPPETVSAGSPFGLVASASNAAGNVDSTFSGSITLSLQSSEGGTPHLAGTLTALAIHGSAIFTDLNVDLAGVDAILATGVGLGGAISEPFSIVGTSSAPNQAPVAQNDSATTTKNKAVVINVLSNDSDPDGTIDPTSVAIVGSASHGTLSVNPTTGAVTYTPASKFSGPDSFTYKVKDNSGSYSNVATVSLLVVGGNQPPVANNDSVTTTKNTALSINVLSNDSDPDGSIDVRAVAIVAKPSHGKVSVDSKTGVVKYTPAENYTGSDSFTYKVKDKSGAYSNIAKVSLTVTQPNRPPIAKDDTVTTAKNTLVNINILSNDKDTDGTINPATVAIVGAPKHGTASVNPTTGVVSYTPAANYSGPDAFTYKVKDNLGASSNVASVCVTVKAPNQPPQVHDDSATTNKNKSVKINVLANDRATNCSIDVKSLLVVDGPSHGTIKIDSKTGAITYTPDKNYTGSDTFTYMVKDNRGVFSNIATVKLTVNR